jgi:hypothetical protein
MKRLADLCRGDKCLAHFFNFQNSFMYQTSYAFSQLSVTRYVFTSVGRTSIEKVVDFADLGVKNAFNLWRFAARWFFG